MFLTVKEAILASGKSQTTIHRLCQKNEATKFIKKENNKFLIDHVFLTKQYPDTIKVISINGSNGSEALLKTISEKNLEITGLTVELNNLKSDLQNKKNKIEELKEEDAAEVHELIDKTELINQMQKKDEKIEQLTKTYDKAIDAKIKEIQKLKEDLLESHHELAEMTDSAINYERELSAINDVQDFVIGQTAAEEKNEEAPKSNRLEENKKMLMQQIIGYSASAIALILFIYVLYRTTM